MAWCCDFSLSKQQFLVHANSKKPLVDPQAPRIQKEDPIFCEDEWAQLETADDGFLLIHIHHLINVETSRRVYCVLDLGQQRAFTALANESLYWDESFSFFCFEGDKRLLKIQVFEGSDEKTKIIGDSLIGECVRYIHTTQPWKKTYWQSMDLTMPIDAKFPNPGAIKISTRFIPAESNVSSAVNGRVLLDKFGFDIGDRGVSYELLQSALKSESKIPQEKFDRKKSKVQAAADGIGLPYKAMLWEYYAKNNVAISDQLFEDDAYEVSLKCTKNNIVDMQIDHDIPRTFPEHAAFKLHEGKAALRRVVTAVSYWNPAIRYCQSMANIVALLLLLTDEERAFRLSVTLIHYIIPDYYSNNLIGLQVDMVVFSKLFAKYLPDLLKHFVNLKVDIVSIINSWFLNIYSRSFPLNTIYRLWDLIFVSGEGSACILRIALAIFKLHEPFLLRVDELELIDKELQKRNALLYHWEEILKIIAYQDVSTKEIESIRKKATVIVVENQQEREHQKMTENQLTLSQLIDLKVLCLIEGKSFQITKHEFHHYFERFRHTYQISNLDVDFNEHLFNVFQLEQEGVIDIREYCICLASTAPVHGMKNKIAFLFALFDSSASFPNNLVDIENPRGTITLKDVRLIILWQYKSNHLPLSSEGKLETLTSFAWGGRPVDATLNFAEFRDICQAQPFTFML